MIMFKMQMKSSISSLTKISSRELSLLSMGESSSAENEQDHVNLIVSLLYYERKIPWCLCWGSLCKTVWIARQARAFAFSRRWSSSNISLQNFPLISGKTGKLKTSVELLQYSTLIKIQYQNCFEHICGIPSRYEPLVLVTSQMKSQVPWKLGKKGLGLVINTSK